MIPQVNIPRIQVPILRPPTIPVYPPPFIQPVYPGSNSNYHEYHGRDSRTR